MRHAFPPVIQFTLMKNLKHNLLYWIPNGLLLLLMMGSGVMYFLQPEEVAKSFAQIGYPVYTIYFNATAKILGGIAILSPVPRFLKEWAYAGYLYILLLATQAVWVMMPAGSAWLMFVFIGIWALSYWQFRKKVGTEPMHA